MKSEPQAELLEADLCAEVGRGLKVTWGHLVKKSLPPEGMRRCSSRAAQASGRAASQPASADPARDARRNAWPACAVPPPVPQLHSHRGGGGRRSLEGENVPDLRNRSPALRLLRLLRGGVPGGRHPHGHRRGHDRGPAPGGFRRRARLPAPGQGTEWQKIGAGREAPLPGGRRAPETPEEKWARTAPGEADKLPRLETPSHPETSEAGQAGS